MRCGILKTKRQVQFQFSLMDGWMQNAWYLHFLSNTSVVIGVLCFRNTTHTNKQKVKVCGALYPPNGFWLLQNDQQIGQNNMHVRHVAVLCMIVILHRNVCLVWAIMHWVENVERTALSYLSESQKYYPYLLAETNIELPRMCYEEPGAIVSTWPGFRVYWTQYNQQYLLSNL